MKFKALVIVGPTATGKTDIALNLAKRLNGELIACDSRQVYKGLDIGAGKAPGSVLSTKYQVFKGEGYWEIDGIKVYMYDVFDPKKRYTVYDYVKDASLVACEILDKGKLPIIVGGTGLYLKGLLEGFSNLDYGIDEGLRKELEALSLLELQELLKKKNLGKWEGLNESERKNKRRLIRRIEIISAPKKNESKIKGLLGFDILKIGLTSDKESLDKRIAERVESRILLGMIEEAERLHRNGLSILRMKELGLEYGVLSDLLEGRISREEFSKVLKTKIYQYAKRQMTWFKKEKEVCWFDINSSNFLENLEKVVVDWYNSADD